LIIFFYDPCTVQFEAWAIGEPALNLPRKPIVGGAKGRLKAIEAWLEWHLLMDPVQ
jgi:hypothetical protein